MDDNHTRVIDVEGGIRAATDDEVEAEDHASEEFEKANH